MSLVRKAGIIPESQRPQESPPWAYLTKNKPEVEKRLDYVNTIFPILKDRIKQKQALFRREQQMLASDGFDEQAKLLLLDEPPGESHQAGG